MQKQLQKVCQDLQNQIDGQIETFYYDYEPTLKNIPASDWTTEDDKKKHEGDLFIGNLKDMHTDSSKMATHGSGS